MRYQVAITFTEPVLGTVPKNADIYADYIASKASPDQDTDDELETVDKAEARGWTGFHVLDGQPILYDYVIKGFFKDACGMLRRAQGTKSAKIRAYKKIIDGLVFVQPRRIPIILPTSETTGIIERPLRAQTAQGERVTLTRSDTCPAGSRIEFTLTILGQVTHELLKEWLDYGALRGIGQWRNAGYGTFTYELTQT